MRNLLLIVVDCARAEKTVTEVACATPGTRRSALLPGWDRLRRAGATWTQYVAVSSTTTPNFATMFTGLLPHEHGVVEHSRHTLRDVPTLAGILRTHGVRTHAEVTGPLRPEAGLDRGFDEYVWRDRAEHLEAGFGDRVRCLLRDLPEPWFLVVHAWEAHMPYHVPTEYATTKHGATAYDRALAAQDAELRRLLEAVDPARTSIVLCGDHGERLHEDWMLRRELGAADAAAYAAWNAFHRGQAACDHDAWFAHATRELGGTTARIYAHNVLGHGFHLTDDLVRTPLVIVDPRCPPGASRTELRSQADLFPTLLDLAGVPAAAHPVAERSFLRAKAPDAVYVEANGSGGRQLAARCYLRGARTERFKYWRVEAEGVQHRVLWDLAADPRETHDVSACFPDVTGALDARVTRWLRRAPAGAPRSLAPEDEAALATTLRSLGYL